MSDQFRWTVHEIAVQAEICGAAFLLTQWLGCALSCCQNKGSFYAWACPWKLHANNLPKYAVIDVCSMSEQESVRPIWLADFMERRCKDRNVCFFPAPLPENLRLRWSDVSRLTILVWILFDVALQVHGTSLLRWLLSTPRMRTRTMRRKYPGTRPQVELLGFVNGWWVYLCKRRCWPEQQAVPWCVSFKPKRVFSGLSYLNLLNTICSTIQEPLKFQRWCIAVLLYGFLCAYGKPSSRLWEIS